MGLLLQSPPDEGIGIIGLLLQTDSGFPLQPSMGLSAVTRAYMCFLSLLFCFSHQSQAWVMIEI